MSEHKRRGRPPLQDGHKAREVCVRLTEDMHDRACRIANRRGVSVSDVVRRALSSMVQSTRSTN